MSACINFVNKLSDSGKVSTTFSPTLREVIDEGLTQCIFFHSSVIVACSIGSLCWQLDSVLISIGMKS